MRGQEVHGHVAGAAHLPLAGEAVGVPVAGQAAALALRLEGDGRLHLNTIINILTYLHRYNYLGDGALAGADRELGGGEDWLGARARDVGHRGRHV